MPINVDQRVKGKYGPGKIIKIITPSSGYVEVAYDNGQKNKEMAFNLTDETGTALKKKPKSDTAGMSRGQKKRHKDQKASEAFKALPNAEKFKRSILGINGIVKGDRNSPSYQAKNEILSGIWLVAKEKNDTFIMDVIKSIEKRMKATDKQANVLAKFADDNNMKYEDQ